MTTQTTVAAQRAEVVAVEPAVRIPVRLDVVGWLDAHGAPAGGVLAAGLALLLAAVSIGTNAADDLVLPVGVVVMLAELFLLSHIFHAQREVDPPLVMLTGATLLAMAIVGALPPYFAAFGQSAIFHRSVVSVVLLCAIALPLLSLSLFHLLGATPSAGDIARYPVVVLPAAVLLSTYVGLLGTLFIHGAPQLSWDIVVTSVTGNAATSSRLQPGYANNLLGTGLLILMTALFSLPIGVGTGVFLNEYATPRMGPVVRFSATALRGISVLLLGLTAISLAQLSHGTWLEGLLVASSNSGTFVLATLVVSLLVIPVIARATEEGCRSLPSGLREGSFALGATDGYTLWRIILPWALPNIVTSVLLGSAEAAGSLATLLFIATAGSTGVGPLQPVTTLTYAMFDATYSGYKSYRDAMQPHQLGGAVLLIVIAVALTAAGLWIKSRYSSRDGSAKSQ